MWGEGEGAGAGRGRGARQALPSGGSWAGKVHTRGLGRGHAPSAFWASRMSIWPNGETEARQGLRSSPRGSLRSRRGRGRRGKGEGSGEASELGRRPWLWNLLFLKHDVCFLAPPAALVTWLWLLPVTGHSGSSVDARRPSGPQTHPSWVDFSRLRPATDKQGGSWPGCSRGRPLPRNLAVAAADR